MNDDLRQAFALTSEGARPRADCPPEERLWEVVHGRRPPAEAGAMLDHVASCGACVEAWRLAKELAQPRHPETRTVVRRGWRAASWGLAAAAALVVVAGAVLWRGPSREPFPPVTREGAEIVLRSLLPEDQPLARGMCLLRWTPAGTGATYDLYVVTEDLRNIASTKGVQTNEFLVPETAISPLPAGARIVWRVSAHLPDGRVIASQSFIQRLEP